MSGGAGVLISDVASDVGLAMPEMPEATQKYLRELVPFCAPRNPVDATAQVGNDVTLISKFTEAVVRDGGYASVLGFFSMTASSRRWPLIARATEPGAGEISRTGCTRCRSSRRAIASTNWRPTAGSATRTRRARWSRSTRWAASAPRSPRRRGAPPPAVHAVTLPDATPSEAEAKRLLASAGITSAPEQACASAEEAVAAAELFGFPVVMKILSPDILHKSEIGGVLLDVADDAAVRDGYDLLLARAKRAAPDARIEGVLVAKQLQGGVECILGIHRDPVFGPIAMFGLGGIFVEVMKDVVFRRCPFGADVAEADDPLDQGRAAAAGRARPAAGGHPCAGADAGAAVGVRGGGRAAAAIDRPEPGVRHAGRPRRVRGGCGDRSRGLVPGSIAVRLRSIANRPWADPQDVAISHLTTLWEETTMPASVTRFRAPQAERAPTAP